MEKLGKETLELVFCFQKGRRQERIREVLVAVEKEVKQEIIKEKGFCKKSWVKEIFSEIKQ